MVNDWFHKLDSPRMNSGIQFWNGRIDGQASPAVVGEGEKGGGAFFLAKGSVFPSTPYETRYEKPPCVSREGYAFVGKLRHQLCPAIGCLLRILDASGGAAKRRSARPVQDLRGSPLRPAGSFVSGGGNTHNKGCFHGARSHYAANHAATSGVPWFCFWDAMRQK